MVLLGACSDEGVISNNTETPDASAPLPHTDEYKVLISAGAVNQTSISTRANVIPYMGDGGRFVCRMYYIGDLNNNNKFDTYNTAWLRVDGAQNSNSKTYQGNSLYWNKDYTPATIVDAYGFDKSANCFYWQNRKNHAFLAITDLHKAFSSDYTGNAPETGNRSNEYLKMDGNPKADGNTEPDYILEEKQGELIVDKYELWGTNETFNTLDALKGWVREHSSAIASTDSRNLDEFRHWNDDNTMFYEDWEDLNVYPLATDGTGEDTSQEPVRDVKIRSIWKFSTADDNTPAKQFKANAYDLRHYIMTKSGNTMTQGAIVASSFADQPDPAQALTIMYPHGATQEANRVELYFEHCFSQVQVNVQQSPDHSVDDLTPGSIEKVELLGVSETGYVFYELDENGFLHKPTYKPVVSRDYPSQWWEDHDRTGTAMEMYQMNETARGSLKSFNCIAFGRLKAIRIHWRENTGENSEGELHVATREVEEKYSTLQSGTKYIFDIAMRRGTLAVLQAEIVKWDTDPKTYSTPGTIIEDSTPGSNE